eukprot:maker-scaffold_12-snap-gene-11.20-mRNA-1 protein AED:0.00 eAED:0.00 QI:55/1/1/1/1/1/2/49/330
MVGKSERSPTFKRKNSYESSSFRKFSNNKSFSDLVELAVKNFTGLNLFLKNEAYLSWFSEREHQWLFHIWTCNNFESLSDLISLWELQTAKETCELLQELMQEVISLLKPLPGQYEKVQKHKAKESSDKYVNFFFSNLKMIIFSVFLGFYSSKYNFTALLEKAKVDKIYEEIKDLRQMQMSYSGASSHNEISDFFFSKEFPSVELTYTNLCVIESFLYGLEFFYAPKRIENKEVFATPFIELKKQISEIVDNFEETNEISFYEKVSSNSDSFLSEVDLKTQNYPEDFESKKIRLCFPLNFRKFGVVQGEEYEDEPGSENEEPMEIMRSIA